MTLSSLNLRELGGMPLANGLTFAPGRFFRSGDPSRLGSPDALALAETLGLRTVIDLRTTQERIRHGLAPSFPNCEHLHRPLFQRILPHWLTSADQSPLGTATRYVEMLEVGAAPLAGIVLALADRVPHPSLIHCAAGRDRTGIVVASVLELLGASDEAIADDYARSDDAANDFGRAHAQTMIHFLRLVRERYGSTRELLAPLGVSDDVLAKLSSHWAVAGADPRPLERP